MGPLDWLLSFLHWLPGCICAVLVAAIWWPKPDTTTSTPPTPLTEDANNTNDETTDDTAAQQQQQPQQQQTPAVAEPPPEPSEPSTPTSRRVRKHLKARNRKRDAAKQHCTQAAPPAAAETTSNTALIDLPDALLAEVFNRVDGALSKRNFYCSCKAIRESESINANIWHLCVPPNNTTEEDSFDDCLLNSLEKWPKLATLRSLTLREPSCSCSAGGRPGFTPSVEGYMGEIAQHPQAMDSDELEEASSSDELDSDLEDDVFSTEELDSSEFDDDDEDYESSDYEDSEEMNDMHTEMLSTAFTALCCKPGTRPRSLITHVEALALQNWDLCNDHQAFAIGSIVSASCPRLSTLSLLSPCPRLVSVHPSLLSVPAFATRLTNLEIFRSVPCSSQSIAIIAELSALMRLKWHMMDKDSHEDDSSDDSDREEEADGHKAVDLQPLCALSRLQSLDLAVQLKSSTPLWFVHGLDKVVSSCRELRVLALHGLDPANSLEKISPARLFSLSLSHLPVASLGAISFSGAACLKHLRLGIFYLPSTEASASAETLAQTCKQIAALNLESSPQSLHLQSEGGLLDWSDRAFSCLAPLGCHLKEFHLKDFILPDGHTLAGHLPLLTRLRLTGCTLSGGVLPELVQGLKELRWLEVGPCNASQICQADVRKACAAGLSSRASTLLRITMVGMRFLDLTRCYRWSMRGDKRQHRVELELVSFAAGAWAKKIIGEWGRPLL